MKRRKQGKTDYKARITLLKGKTGRVVFRKTNRYIIGQYIKSEEAKDRIIVGVFSRKLLEYGWPKTATGSLKSIPASYLTGFLLGKEMLEKDEKQGIFDIGLLRSIEKSKPYAFLKGIIDAGIDIKADKKMFPEEKRIIGGNLKISLDFNKIKENIEKKFI